jgi:hypothetical protein
VGALLIEDKTAIKFGVQSWHADQQVVAIQAD